jgi:hypothetical protein
VIGVDYHLGKQACRSGATREDGKCRKHVIPNLDVDVNRNTCLKHTHLNNDLKKSVCENSKSITRLNPRVQIKLIVERRITRSIQLAAVHRKVQTSIRKTDV